MTTNTLSFKTNKIIKFKTQCKCNNQIYCMITQVKIRVNYFLKTYLHVRKTFIIHIITQ